MAVLTGLTETIRGLVEVQQAEIDRQQTNTIAIAGLGLAGSSAFVGIIATQVQQTKDADSSDRLSVEEGLRLSMIPSLIILCLYLLFHGLYSIRSYIGKKR